ncbi:MAG TPA: hypothetical protein VFQ67_08520 [Allosphingosinicella sp.]|nr:hypothetical protein [Allosphingosinicella sp.]
MLAAALACSIASSPAARAQAAGAKTAVSDKSAPSDDLARCAIENHPDEARWFGSLLARKVSVEQQAAGGAFLNALGELLKGCLADGSRLDFDVFVASVRQFAESPFSGTARPGPMDALGDCFLRVAPQEAMAFLRESDIEAGKSLSSLESNPGGSVALQVSSVSDPAFRAMLSKSLSERNGCGPALKKLGDRVDGNQVYWRLNWLLRAAPQLGARK